MFIGEIRRATEAGFKVKDHKVIWAACIDCGKERWVFLKKESPRSIRCRSCSSKINGEASKGTHLSPERIAKIRITNTGEGNGMFGKHHSEETKRKISLAHKGKRIVYINGHANFNGEKNPNYRGGRIIHCDNCGAEIYRCPYRILNHSFCNSKCVGEWQSRSSEFLALVMKANRIKPNRKELILLRIIQELSLPYRYVGDGEFILGGKCPDYLNTNGQKKLIELFGNFWHNGQNPQKRIDYFAQYGFQTLVIWESELEDTGTLKEKLVGFNAKRLGLP